MTTFTQETLKHLKSLSRIDCSQAEEAELLVSLQRVLSYTKQLDEIDTEGVAPCSHVLSSILKTTVRPDETENLLPRETFLANAPDQVGGMIRIPPVLKDL